MKFCTRVRLKPSIDRCEFELDQARSKNNIAENSFALGHETDSTWEMIGLIFVLTRLIHILTLLKDVII